MSSVVIRLVATAALASETRSTPDAISSRAPRRWLHPGDQGSLVCRTRRTGFSPRGAAGKRLARTRRSPKVVTTDLNAAAIVANISVGEINRARRVFLTHGKNRTFIESIKNLLAFGELEAVVSAERQPVSQAVPDKVMSDMLSCGAAIIHIDDEMRLLDKSAQELVILNPNMLIEIGAAMALYGRRFSS